MKKVLFLLADTALVIGGVIGAGFASGEEISLYFYGKNALLSAFIAFAVFFLIFCVFLEIGEKFGSLDAKAKNNALLSDGCFSAAKILRIFLLADYFVVLCSMLAGANVTLSSLFSTRQVYFAFGAITALICGVILFFDIRGIKRFNFVVVPFIIVLIVSVCLLNTGYDKPVGSGGGGSAFMYVCMNCVMMSGILISMGSKKTVNKFAVSLCSAAILAVLLYLIILRVNSVDFDIAMPLLYYAFLINSSVGTMMSVVIYFAIITTVVACAYPLIEWLNTLVRSRIFAIAAVFSAALCVSLIGFSKIVAYAYPVISVLGLMVIVFYIVLLLSVKIRDKKLRA